MPNTTFSECILSHMFLQTNGEQAFGVKDVLKVMIYRGESEGR
jgi:hypothetical protein